MTEAEFDTEAYVRQAAALLGISLDDDIVAGVVQHFGIAAGLADQIMAIELQPDDEPAPRFDP